MSHFSTVRRILLKLKIIERFSKPYGLLKMDDFLNNIDSVLYLDNSSLFGSKHGQESYRLFKKSKNIGVYKLTYRPYGKKI